MDGGREYRELKQRRSGFDGRIDLEPERSQTCTATNMTRSYVRCPNGEGNPNLTIDVFAILQRAFSARLTAQRFRAVLLPE